MDDGVQTVSDFSLHFFTYKHSLRKCNFSLDPDFSKMFTPSPSLGLKGLKRTDKVTKQTNIVSVIIGHQI